MNILVNLPPTFFSTPALRPIFARLETYGTVRYTSHNTQAEILPDLAEQDAIIMWAWPLIDEDMIAAHPRLRYIGFLDVMQSGARAAVAKGLPISNSRSGFSPAVAEMALALMLTCLRKVSDYHAQMRAGVEKWVTEYPGDIDPQERELTGRAVGIIGLGGVGRRLAELLQPFRCELKIADPYVPEDVVAKAGATRCEVDELVRSSEIIVLCAASNSGTSKLIDGAKIQSMAPGTLFINVARAALVDYDALVARLHTGDIQAALDVFDQEPLPADHPLRACANAYLTPHRAGGIMISNERILNYLIDDLDNVVNGRPQKFAVTERMISALDA